MGDSNAQSCARIWAIIMVHNVVPIEVVKNTQHCTEMGFQSAQHCATMGYGDTRYCTDMGYNGAQHCANMGYKSCMLGLTMNDLVLHSMHGSRMNMLCASVGTLVRKGFGLRHTCFMFGNKESCIHVRLLIRSNWCSHTGCDNEQLVKTCAF